jgi:hypothetical protein
MLTRQIRYLADQWKINGIFSPINELKAPYQPKNNGIGANRKRRTCGHLSAVGFPDGEGRPPWQKSFSVEARPQRLDQICGLQAYGPSASCLLIRRAVEG